MNILRLRINRYMLGCKYVLSRILHLGVAELIDTCWDVNQDSKVENLQKYLELIDTCWDVNELFGAVGRTIARN